MNNVVKANVSNIDFILCLTQNTQPVDLSSNEYFESSFQFYDERLVNDIKSGNKNCKEFFRLLAVCHTVVTEANDEGKLDSTQFPLMLENV